MFKQYLLVTFAVLLFNVGNSQITFNKKYDTEILNDNFSTGIIELNNNYYLLDYGGNLTKIDINGNSVWNLQNSEFDQAGLINCYGENLCALGDGNILIAGNINTNNAPYNRTTWTKVDITGKIVYSTTVISEENYIQLRLNLPSGIYTLQLKNKDECIRTLKIAINN